MPRPANTSPQTLRVLALLLESPRAWHYGYGVSQHTGLKSGTLYPILARLAEQGLLATRWSKPEEPGRPPRHSYRLTSLGVRVARQNAADVAPKAYRLRAALSVGRHA